MSVPKLAFFGNEFPSDDVKDVFRRLLRHTKDRRFRLLAAFVDESTAVLKDEVAKLPQPLKELVPHFDTVLSLAEHGDFRQGALGAAMESALLTVLEVALFIGHHEAEGIDMSVTGLAGLSIGLLAAAAVALSSSVSDLLGNGAESVRVAFRLGVYVADVSSKLEAPQPDGTLQSWAHVVTELSEETVRDELERFNTDTRSPALSRAFVSAADKTSVSVSAPPSRLNQAFQHSHRLRYSKSLPLPVYDGLCHAPHLYTPDDIQALLDPKASLLPPNRPVRIPLLSSQSGEPFTATTAHDLFLQIATELTTGTIYLDRLTAAILAHAAAAECCYLSSFRTSLVLKGIADALAADSQLVRSDMVSWVHVDFGPRRPRSSADAKLAIVGMACRLPGGANDPDLFWELLEQGRDVHTTVPVDRFDLETHYDPNAKVENATQTPFGNFMDRPGFFDAGFFNMSPREAEQTDPMHRLALVTAYEAMEMAGLVPGRTASSRPQRIATFYGQASDDWRELNASQNIGTYAVPGGERAFANGRVNYFFKFSGPSFNIDTACSSGLAAVQAACSALWAGEADTVLAGGLNVITDPDNYAGLCNGHFLSKTGQCKVWDKDADGYCRADGVGSVVIKRLEDAEADNDNILAVVLAAATNHSAEAISITHPHAGAQKDNYRHVLQKAGVSPLDVGYVELHGTGTQAGDAVESESVADIFAPVAPRRRADQRLHLGAVKSNIGHGEAAAGIASLIKALLVYQKNMIPAHIGIKTEINPTIPTDLERRNIGLTMTNTSWPREGSKKRLAVVNSFGAHGGNTTLLLEDGPEKQTFEVAAVRSTHPIIVSAKSKRSLQANVENLLYYLDQHTDTNLGDLSYTTCARRMHHSIRIATSVSSVAGLQKFLRASLGDKTITDARPIPPEAPGVVFAFTGQGAYHVGMGRELFAAFPAFREQVQQLDRLVQRLGFPSVASVIDGSADDESSPPVLTQLSVVVFEIALARFWEVLGVRPNAVIGHSLGEYAALAVAGALSVADALYLVGRRAQLTEERCTPGSHSMLSVRATEADIARLVRDTPETAALPYEVSCRNTAQDTVIGGARDDIDTIRKALEAHNFKCVQLDIPFAFHTAQMDDILDAFEATAAPVPFKAPSIPVLSPLLGAAVFDGKSINAKYLRRATREPVDFIAAVGAGRDLGMFDDKTLWVDVGPHPICSGFVRGLMPAARSVSSCRRNEDGFATFAKSLTTLHLAGLTPVWAEYFQPDEHAYHLLTLPKYAWNETDYWIPYIGTWTLDKAHLKYGGQKPTGPSLMAASALRTSLVHQITSETIEQTTAELCVLSDIQHPNFLEAVNGHRMNGCGVATSSIWTDMALTVGEYLYRRLVPQAQKVHMNVSDVEVLHAQVANKSKGSTQPLALEAQLDLSMSRMSLAWFNVDAKTGTRAAESFATATVRFEDPQAWRAEWDRVTHLVQGRIDALERMAAVGEASRLSKQLAYTLFKNVVDYAERYRGMDNVVLHEHEAYANITLTPEQHGAWHTPPHWIDSVAHLAGLVMNGSDASNTADYFYVTPGCESARVLEPLQPGARYRSYVRMFPVPGDANMFAGDVYIFNDAGTIVGMVGQIRFRRVPRLLMDRFFSPPAAEPAPDTARVTGYKLPVAAVTPAPAAAASTSKATAAIPASAEVIGTSTAHSEQRRGEQASASTSSGSSGGGGFTPASTTASAPAAETTAGKDGADGDADADDAGIVTQCLALIARETGLPLSALTPDATFVQLGVDSLMALVLAEKLRAELGVEVRSSLFLECPTVGELGGWLGVYC